ncbi:ABC transporter ATP-binding protein [Nonomuraea sp. CA-143628]|uniref:ABC transporter ATP-binding protein n=1 Tax=Nonomuraea sp. CA-143628 TaxID=3239997 RepID=UPI003D8A693E
MTGPPQPLLRLEHLAVDLPVGGIPRRVLHDVSLTIRPGEALGLVGESGSGKSMTSRSVMRLLPYGAHVQGRLEFDGAAINDMSPRDLRRFRASDVALIHQDPRSHINPLRTIGDFLLEALLERGTSRFEARARVVDTLRQVGVGDAERRLDQHPHQLSGGLLQRVMIAAALVVDPRLILADEPTTALDVTTQQEVMAILDEERSNRGMAMVFITHDLDLAIAVTDRVAVMYAGTIVEEAPSARLYDSARHPYTRGLLASRPRLDRTERLSVIPGRPISAYEAGSGCVFAARCPHVTERARLERPTSRVVDDHAVACHRAEEPWHAQDVRAVDA